MDFKEFEQLVALIEKSLCDNDNISVKHDVKILDKNGIKRQIDVLIEVDAGNRLGKVLYIVECKNKNRKIELSEIESFQSKIKNLGVYKGIFVSKSGFQKGVHQLIKSDDTISLFKLSDIQEVEIKTWLNQPKMQAFTFSINYDKTTIEFYPINYKNMLFQANDKREINLKFSEEFDNFTQTLTIKDLVQAEIKENFAPNYEYFFHKFNERLGKRVLEDELFLNLKVPFPNQTELKIDEVIYCCENMMIKVSFHFIEIELDIDMRHKEYIDDMTKERLSEITEADFGKVKFVMLKENENKASCYAVSKETNQVLGKIPLSKMKE